MAWQYDYEGLQPLLAVSSTETTDANDVTIYKIAATNDFTMKFRVDKSMAGFNITVVGEGIDNTGTIRLWQSQDGLTTPVTDWNTLLDDTGSQASLTITAADLIAVFNVDMSAVNNGNVGIDFAKGSISAGTVYVILGK